MGYEGHVRIGGFGDDGISWCGRRALGKDGEGWDGHYHGVKRGCLERFRLWGSLESGDMGCKGEGEGGFGDEIIWVGAGGGIGTIKV